MTRNVSGWFVPVVLLSVTAYALAEDLTLTTYYPSPRGVYQELRTSGDVAIGMTGAPSARLQVVGSLNAPALYVVGQGGTTTLRVDDHPDAGGDPTPFLINSDGNVGIGTSSPSGSAKLDVQGRVKIADGTQGDNKVLTSDANGLASWRTSSSAAPGTIVAWMKLHVDYIPGNVQCYPQPSCSGTPGPCYSWTELWDPQNVLSVASIPSPSCLVAGGCSGDGFGGCGFQMNAVVSCATGYAPFVVNGANGVGDYVCVKN